MGKKKFNVFFGGFCGRGDQWELIIFLNVFFGGGGGGCEGILVAEKK